MSLLGAELTRLFQSARLKGKELRSEDWQIEVDAFLRSQS